jgi:hypothetical protein
VPECRPRVLSISSKNGGSLDHYTMQTENAVNQCLAEAERRIDAMEVLCEIFVGQLKGERRQLEEVKRSIAFTAPVHKESGRTAPGDIEPEMLG